MAVQLGANTKDHRAFVTLAGVSWGEFEELDAPEPVLDSEVRFREPGSVFEASGGGVYSMDGLEGQRHWKRGRDRPLHKQYLDAVTSGRNLEGTISYHEVKEDGTIDPSPYLTIDVLMEKCKTPNINSSSEDALLEVGFSPNGAPR